MPERCLEHAERIRLGGIKLSPELVQFNLVGAAAGLPLAALLGRMTEQRISLPSLSLTRTRTAVVVNFCVAADDFSQAQHNVQAVVSAEHAVEILPSVGIVTLFPHRRSMVVLGLVIDILDRAAIPLYAVGSSLSSLAVTTEYRLLDRAVLELEKRFDLPCNHAPFRSECDPNTAGV